MNIIIFGPPGSGKGTQADLLAQRFDFAKVSTGDLLREEIRSGSQLGQTIAPILERGDFPDSKIVNASVESFVDRESHRPGFIFDGYPRTIAQADALSTMLCDRSQKVDLVIALEVADDLLIERISGRLFCEDCRRGYHVKYNPPKQQGICDHCGGRHLKKRSDDTEETLRQRLAVYREKTVPVLEYYQAQGMLKQISGEKGIDEISSTLIRMVKLTAESHKSEVG